MASEQHMDKRAQTEREPPKNVRSPSKPAPQDRQPLHTDGIELLRDANC